MRKLLIIVCFFLLSSGQFVQAFPKREIRAVWLATAYGLDWPSAPATTLRGIRHQKAELCRILDQLQETHINTVLFQTRIRSDVAYPSDIEPWNEIFSGKEGVSPGYDPLAFAIEECHKRGMELHAWIVTIPLGTERHVRRVGKVSVTRRQPQLCKKYQGEWYLDPGQPETKNYLMRLVREVVTRYDVDGIHLDYIRYPDHPAQFNDRETFRKYGRGKALSQWRRENITSVVRHLYQGIKALKPWVKVSSSPIGKFKDTSRYSSSGWNAYYAVYQDAQGWLKEGIQDVLFPMMYFRGNGFFPFALDWHQKAAGRYIVPGLGIYFLHPKERDWPLEEIERQLNFSRRHGLEGQAYYRSRFITDNTKNLMNELVCRYYPYPALPPALSWIDSIPPTIPRSLTVERRKTGDVFLSWQPSIDNDKRATPYYIVYTSDVFPVDSDNPENILATHISDPYYLYSPDWSAKQKKYFAVSSLDRYGNESQAVQLDEARSYSALKVENEFLSLPAADGAMYFTLTDIVGRCVLQGIYQERVSLGKLEKGVYRVLLTDASQKVRRSGEVIYE